MPLLRAIWKGYGKAEGTSEGAIEGKEGAIEGTTENAADCGETVGVPERVCPTSNEIVEVEEILGDNEALKERLGDSLREGLADKLGVIDKDGVEVVLWLAPGGRFVCENEGEDVGVGLLVQEGDEVRVLLMDGVGLFVGVPEGVAEEEPVGVTVPVLLTLVATISVRAVEEMR